MNTVIRWPPDATISMSVVGFQEAFESSVEYLLDSLPIRVVSVPGLAVLKLVAWLDRRHETSKDATDFAQILRAYQYVVGSDRLYGEEIGALEAADFHVDAGAAHFWVETLPDSSPLKRDWCVSVYFMQLVPAWRTT